MYPGHHFACMDKLKYYKLPMLYYNDQIPKFELCKMENEGDEDVIDANTRYRWNEYATKMFLFFPFWEKTDFPIF
jgi:hypothetical protein